MPEYSNLPQPRQQASIASAAAAVAAQAQQAASNSSTSFNSKRSRHSSLWSLQDEQELLEQQQGDHSNTGDMVNYVNDFGHSSEFSASSAGIQMMRQQQLNDEMESQMRSSFQNSSSNSKARHSNAASAASNEALNWKLAERSRGSDNDKYLEQKNHYPSSRSCARPSSYLFFQKYTNR